MGWAEGGGLRNRTEFPRGEDRTHALSRQGNGPACRSIDVISFLFKWTLLEFHSHYDRQKLLPILISVIEVLHYQIYAMLLSLTLTNEKLRTLTIFCDSLTRNCNRL